ncbi:MAG TPA: DoxX family protein [Longimicrobium sp.]|nr:DoxX family protein [Longimicrobium sp.]
MAAFFMSRYEEITLLLLRVMAGLMLMQHGAQKIFGVLGGEVQPTFTRGWFAGVLELVLPPLVVLGLGTRPAAFILAGEMAFAYFLGHASGGFWPVVNRGELAALYSFVFLYLSARGAGRYSLDAMLARRRGPSTHGRPSS